MFSALSVLLAGSLAMSTTVGPTHSQESLRLVGGSLSVRAISDTPSQAVISTSRELVEVQPVVLRVSDTTGQGAGWHLLGTTLPLRDASGRIIPASVTLNGSSDSAASSAPPKIAALTSSTDTADVSYPVNLTSVNQTFYAVSPGAGMGISFVTADLWWSLPPGVTLPPAVTSVVWTAVIGP